MAKAMNFIRPEDPLAFRQALGSFATGLTIVTGQRAEGERFGLTASSFQSVSLSPPLVLYSIRKNAASIPLLLQAGSFCVNVLGEGHGDLARRFASPVADRFDGIDWERGALGGWVLPDAIAVFECRLWSTYDGGDHLIVVGEVEDMYRAPQGNPLLFFQGEFRPIGPALSPVS